MALSVIGCGKKNEGRGHKFDSNHRGTLWPEVSPETVVVKVDASTGEVYYATLTSIQREMSYQDLIRNDQLSFRRQSSDSVILHSYPTEPSEQLYFVENVQDFKREKREVNSYYLPGGNRGYYYYNCGYQYGYWGYYNYCGSAYAQFYHYYPMSWSYQYEFRYQPVWYWNSVYYYYTPTYYYDYRDCYYYIYVR